MTPKKKPGRRVDLNAAHRARDEKTRAAPFIELGEDDEGKPIRFDLPARLPAAVAYGISLMEHGDGSGFADAVNALFGDRVKEALANGLEIDDLIAIASLYLDDDEDAAGN